MSIEMWVAGKFFPHITQIQAAEFEELLRAGMCYNQECSVETDGFIIGWFSAREEDTFDELLDRLPEGTTVELATDYMGVDQENLEYRWRGPQAKELEIQHINGKIFALNRRKDQLERQLEAQKKQP